jgi:hypothetical protein
MYLSRYMPLKKFLGRIMSDFTHIISKVDFNTGHQRAGSKARQPATNSFENVLQRDNIKATDPRSLSTDSTTGISGETIEKLRIDLMKRLNELPSNRSNSSVLLPELFETKTRFKLLRQALLEVRENPKAIHISDRFRQIESQWYDLEQIMKSDKDLSQGELLGLQARLYQVSQHIEVLSKAVDQMTNGIRTILNTNV